MKTSPYAATVLRYVWAPTVTRTGGRLPFPSRWTISAGTGMPVAVFPSSRIVARNLIGRAS